jgi:hypothetical protein
MNAATLAVSATRQIDPISAFQARCEARAILYGAGELDLHKAVDKLQADAVRDGLVRSIGQDAVQTDMAAGFRPVREVEWAAEQLVEHKGCVQPQAKHGVRSGTHSRTPGSTVEALMWLLRERGLSCLNDVKNRDRLRRCDAAAIKEMSGRLLDLNSRSKGRAPNWTEESIAKLVSMWTKERKS